MIVLKHNVKKKESDCLFYLHLACECEAPGSISNACDLENGQCQCDHNFGGRACERCEHGFFNYTTCTCNILTAPYTNDVNLHYLCLFQIATVIHEELLRKYVTNEMANVSANQGMVELGAISANPVIGVIQTANLAVVVIPEVLQVSALPMENAPVCPISQAALVTSAHQAITDIPNALVSCLLITILTCEESLLT